MGSTSWKKAKNRHTIGTRRYSRKKSAVERRRKQAALQQSTQEMIEHKQSITSNDGNKVLDISVKRETNESLEIKYEDSVEYLMDNDMINAFDETVLDDLDELVTVAHNNEVSSNKSDNTKKPSGRRLVDLDFFMEELHKTFDSHSVACACRIQDVEHISTVTVGLRSKFVFKCKMCNFSSQIWSEPANEDDYLNVNIAAVLATITIGIGYFQLQELCACLNMECMSDRTYREHLNFVLDQFLKTAAASMVEAADEEAVLAIKRGDVIDGIPCIPVEVDGSYIKRTFGSKYDSLAGLGVIIGKHTQKVLYLSVCHKYCSTCEISKRRHIEIPDHVCSSNFNRNEASTKMESRAIAEGFEGSIELHNLIYKWIISDGDSSIYKAIVDCNPYAKYDLIPERILCTNHLLRNLCKKLLLVSKITQPKGVRDPKFISTRNVIATNILKIRQQVVESVKFRKQSESSIQDQIEQLRRDIIAIPNHIFGDHSNCKDRSFVCQQDNKNEKNHVTELLNFGFYAKIEEAIIYLSMFSESLLHELTTNMAESFNAIVCKNLGGKRINFSHEKQYKTRTSAAAIQHNTQKCISEVYSNMGKEVPAVVKDLETKRQAKILKTRNSRIENGRIRGRHFFSADGDYGLNCNQPDKSPKEIDSLKKIHFEKLEENLKKRDLIEQMTGDQVKSGYWMALRKKMLTASNFGKICNMRPDTSCAATVKSILFGPTVGTEAMEYGRRTEEKARKQLSEQLKKDIVKCGLFIDQQIPYLGASPDGLIDNNGIVEIKCPYSGCLLEAIDVIKNVKSYKNIIDLQTQKMKKNHIYFYQIQGQLHITKRDYCMFTIYTEKSIYYSRIERDDVFWNEYMEPKLIRFYINCLLPEILDSRYLRNMPIRNPSYILEAQEQKSKENKNKKIKSDAKKIRIETNKIQQPFEKIDESNKIFEIVNQSSHVEVDVDSNKEDDVEFISEDVEDWTIERIKEVQLNLNLKATRGALEKVVSNVSPRDSLLDDLSIDSFLFVLSDTTKFLTESVHFPKSLPAVQPIIGMKSIQIIGGNCINHWRCAYYNGDHIEIYDSFKPLNGYNLSSHEAKYLYKRYPSTKSISFKNIVVQQPDSASCGVYAAAFAADLALGKDPSVIKYSQNITEMRLHFLKIIQCNQLLPFPRDL